MIKIRENIIGLMYKPFIIAEMSGNHNGSIERAHTLVDAAADAGVDAIKLQTYTADTITLDIRENEFVIDDKKSLWHGRSLYDLYSEASTPWEWHAEIMEHAADRGLICFSSPFDSSAVDFLESINVGAYKIASPEIVDHGLIKNVAKTMKPVIISTGMATVDEIKEALAICYKEDNHQVALLQCTSSYPSPPKNSNISTILDMRKKFNCEVGLSDHTMGIGVSIAAVSFGCSIIEKHFTLNRSDGGVDSSFSLEPKELSQLVMESKRAWQSIGEVTYGPNESEMGSLKFRRSLYAAENIKVGEKFTSKNIRSIRPNLGIHTRFLDEIIGSYSKVDIPKGTPISRKMF